MSPATNVLPPPDFAVEVTPDRQRVIVAPVGELDAAVVERLRAAVDELLSAGFDTVVLDLRRLQFIDSTGMHCVRELSRRPTCRLAVAPGPPAVQRAFSLTGLAAGIPFSDHLRLPAV